MGNTNTIIITWLLINDWKGTKASYNVDAGLIRAG